MKAETICLNSKVDGKQPFIEDRIYYGGGLCVGITATFASYGCWVLYVEETADSPTADIPQGDSR